MRRQVNGTCVKGMKSASVRMRDKDEERARRGRKFREKRKTCRDIAVDGRERGDRLEREGSFASFLLMAGEYEGAEGRKRVE